MPRSRKDEEPENEEEELEEDDDDDEAMAAFLLEQEEEEEQRAKEAAKLMKKNEQEVQKIASNLQHILEVTKRDESLAKEAPTLQKEIKNVTTNLNEIMSVVEKDLGTSTTTSTSTTTAKTTTARTSRLKSIKTVNDIIEDLGLTDYHKRGIAIVVVALVIWHYYVWLKPIVSGYFQGDIATRYYHYIELNKPNEIKFNETSSKIASYVGDLKQYKDIPDELLPYFKYIGNGRYETSPPETSSSETSSSTTIASLFTIVNLFRLFLGIAGSFALYYLIKPRQATEVWLHILYASEGFARLAVLLFENLHLVLYATLVSLASYLYLQYTLYYGTYGYTLVDLTLVIPWLIWHNPQAVALFLFLSYVAWTFFHRNQ